jgi:CP family cyanate transporter-like MFS transporter
MPGDQNGPGEFVQTSSERGRGRLVVVVPAVVIVLVALCLRGPFAAVGPLLGELSQQLSVPLTALAVLASLPLLVFALLSPAAPVLAARIGLHRAVVAGVLLLALGIAVRLAGVVGLFAGTVLLSAGIAVANVLLPAVARAEYGERAAGVVGLVTASMAVSAALGAGLAQPFASAAGGSALRGLVFWLLPVLVAAIAVALLARARRGTAASTPAPAGDRTGILRDRVAIAVTLFFGFQSLSFYAMLTWLPDVLESDAGVSAVTAGVLTAVAALLGGPASLVVPTLAARLRSQAPAVVAVAVPTLVSLAGLLLAPSSAPLLWALLYGIGTGSAFPLSMTIVLLRTRDVAQTGRLSAAAQSAGYLLAATGPIAVGALAEVTGGWRAGLLALVAVQVAQTAAGVAAGRPRLVSASA